MPDAPEANPPTVVDEAGFLSRIGKSVFEYAIVATVTVWLFGILLGYVSGLVGSWLDKPDLSVGGSNETLSTIVVALFGVIIGRRVNG